MNQTFKYNNTTFENFLLALRDSKVARREFIDAIVSTGYDECYLEFPAYFTGSKNNPAEFTITESKPFKPANWAFFKNKLSNKTRASKKMISFKNLSGDAVLVIPVPDGTTNESANHLMNYLKNGDIETNHLMIAEVARKTLAVSDGQKLYVSTHGHGVPWLHYRICTKPKNYTFLDYTM